MIMSANQTRGVNMLFAEDGNVAKAFEESILRSIVERKAKICDT